MADPSKAGGMVAAAAAPNLPCRRTETEAADPEKAFGNGAADVQTFLLLSSWDTVIRSCLTVGIHTSIYTHTHGGRCLSCPVFVLWDSIRFCPESTAPFLVACQMLVNN